MSTNIILDRFNRVYDAIDPTKDLKDSAIGKVVMVSGAGRGIGRAIAEAFTKASAQKLILCALEESELQETEETLRTINPNIDIFSRPFDISSTDAVRSFVQDAASWSGGFVDVLCCNAGVSPPQESLVDTDPERWWLGFEVNVKGAYLLARFVLPLMHIQKCGHIIITSARIILGSIPNTSSYSISKLASARLAEIIHLENQHLGVRAFSIHPGGILTRLVTDLISDTEKEADEQAESRASLIRSLATDDISLPGNTCVFLASGKADFMSGRFFDATIGVNQIVENQSAILDHDLLKIAIKGNWEGAGGFNTLQWPAVPATASS